MARPPIPPGKASPAAGLLNQAVAAHQAGHLDDAANLYGQVLAQAPGHFDATHLLGVIALQRGDLASAETQIAAALATKPRDPAALNNLGTTLLRAGRLEDARVQFERAVKAQPNFAGAQSNLGNVLRQLGRVSEAVAPLRKAYAGNPKSAEAADLLGAALLETGDARGAVAVFEAIAKLRPRDGKAWTHLSIASLQAGNAQRAQAAADEALALSADSVEALGARGQALAALGEAGSAREAFARAVQLAPQATSARHNLGVFLREQGELDAAIATLKQAVRLDASLAAAREALVAALIEAGSNDEAASEGRAFSDDQPDSASALAILASTEFARDRIDDALALYARAAAKPGFQAGMHVDYGNALFSSGDAAGATKQFARALELDPQNARARFALAMSHLRPIYDDAAQMDAARRAFTRALGELDAWFTPARAAAGAQAVGSTQPFYSAYHAVDLRPLLAPYGKTAARLMATGAPAAREPARPPLQGRRLRVGIVAAQVRDHSVWNAITQGWVRHLDRQRIELWLFKLDRASDDETGRARRAVDHFVEAPSGYVGWRQAIEEAALDVLIYPEVAMHPLTTRLAATRLAPVQATTWGHPITTGLPTLDLYFSAQALEPPQGASHYSERMVALPRLGVCVQPLAPLAVAPDLAALGLPADEPLLLCAGTPFKYTPQGDAALVAIARGLQERGRGRLVFFRSHRPAMSAQVERRLRAAFAKAGVDHDRTVVWIRTLDRARYFGLMRRATALLDTLGFSGFNTAMQALECELPVVAFEGEFMRGRLASGPLRLLGLDELVANTDAGYADIALRLVDDAGWRAGLQQRIAQGLPALFHDLAPVRALEDALFAAVQG